MEILLTLAATLAVLAAGSYFTVNTLAAAKDLRAKGQQSAAEARLMDEIGRKIAGGDANVIPVGHSCPDPECPVHGKDNR